MPHPNEQAYRKAMERAVSKGEDFTAALHKDFPSVAAPAAGVIGPVAAVFDKTRWHPDSNPWYDNPDRPDVGGRNWQRPYGSGDYASFVKTARTSHGVSSYQFRAPGEWFAEAYAVYYSDQDTAGARVGTRLRTRDSAAADWFDANVDKGYSLRHEAGGGAGGGGAGGGAVARAPGGGGGGAG